MRARSLATTAQHDARETGKGKRSGRFLRPLARDLPIAPNVRAELSADSRFN